MRLLLVAALWFVSASRSNSQETMTFQCEDLRDVGLVLVPVTSPDYAPMLADIQERMSHLPPGPPIMPEQLRRMMFGKISPEKRATSAILINHSDKSIAALELVWRYEEVSGRTYTGSSAYTFGHNQVIVSENQAK